jgi:hypothetical protein
VARLRSAVAVALVGSGLVLGPALWLGLAAWAWAGGLALLAVPPGVLGLSAALLSGLLAVRAARRPGMPAGPAPFSTHLGESAVPVQD